MAEFRHHACSKGALTKSNIQCYSEVPPNGSRSSKPNYKLLSSLRWNNTAMLTKLADMFTRNCCGYENEFKPKLFARRLHMTFWPKAVFKRKLDCRISRTLGSHKQYADTDRHMSLNDHKKVLRFISNSISIRWNCPAPRRLCGIENFTRASVYIVGNGKWGNTNFVCPLML